MGKNDDRYGKLELEKGEGSSKKKESKFKRKLEIFGIPQKKVEQETTSKKSALDDLTPPPEQKVSETKKIKKRPVSARPQRNRHNPAQRKKLKKKFEDLEAHAEEALKDPSIMQPTSYDEKLKRNRKLPEYKKREIRRKGEAKIKREQAQERVNTARSTIMWAALLVVGMVVLVYMTDGVGSEFIIEIGLALLFAFLGIRGGYRRWWH